MFAWVKGRAVGFCAGVWRWPKWGRGGGLSTARGRRGFREVWGFLWDCGVKRDGRHGLGGRVVVILRNNNAKPEFNNLACHYRHNRSYFADLDNDHARNRTY